MSIADRMSHCLRTSEPIISRETNGDELPSIWLVQKKGKFIQNRHHTRDRSKGINELKQRLISYFIDQTQITAYLYEISQKYPSIAETSLPSD